MTVLYEQPGISPWGVLIFLYIAGLMFSPLFVRQLWGVRAAMHWAVTEFLIALEVAILAFLILQPALPLQFDPNAPPPGGTGFLVVIERVFYLGFFWIIAVGVPAMAVAAGAVLALMWTAFAHAWHSVRRGRRGD